LIRKEPRQGETEIKSRSERTRIEEKQPRQVGNRIQDKKEPGLTKNNSDEHHGLINTKLGGSAFASTTPGGSDSRTKDQEYKKLKTTTTTTHQDPSSDFFSKEKNSEKARGCGIHSPRIF